MFHIRQESSVTDYVNWFAELIDLLKSYNPNIDRLYYTTRFVDGLRDDICSIVVVQRPNNLDTAYTLALLQEEVAESTRHREYRRDGGSYARASFRNAHHLQPGVANPAARPADAAIAAQANARTAEEWFCALRANRRAKGLCDFYAEKWSRDHKCAANVRLNAMEEILELFSITDDTKESEIAESPAEQLLLAISQEAVSGACGPRTMQFSGEILGLPIVVLVDSGSTTSFLSSRIADQLKSLNCQPVDHKVQIANGSILQCSLLLWIAVSQWPLMNSPIL